MLIEFSGSLISELRKNQLFLAVRAWPFRSSCAVLKVLGDVAVPRSKHEFVESWAPKRTNGSLSVEETLTGMFPTMGVKLNYLCLGFVFPSFAAISNIKKIIV